MPQVAYLRSDRNIATFRKGAGRDRAVFKLLIDIVMNPKRRRNILGRAAVVAVALCAPAFAHAFGEESSVRVGGRNVSTHHLHLTRALATCAGFSHTTNLDPTASPADAERVAIFDAMTDIRNIGTFSNCGAGTYALPTPTGLGCPSGTQSHFVLPDVATGGRGGWNPDAGCFTDRGGPYTHLFHHATEDQLGVLREWAMGRRTTLVNEAHFAFGPSGAQPGEATCFKSRTETINTGRVLSGSFEALGTFLHSLADWYSHAVCRENWGAKANPPWYMHTRGADVVPGCEREQHEWEFGCPTSAHVRYVQNTVDAAKAVFEALLEYGAQKGAVARIASFDAHEGWMRRQVERFALAAARDTGAPRVDLAHALLLACDGFSAGGEVCIADLPTSTGSDPVCTTVSPTALCESAVVDAGTEADAGAGAEAGAGADAGVEILPPTSGPAPYRTQTATDSGGCSASPVGAPINLFPLVLLLITEVRSRRRRGRAERRDQEV